VHLETKQCHWNILRYISASCFQLKRSNMHFSLGLGLSLVCETGGKTIIENTKTHFNYWTQNMLVSKNKLIACCLIRLYNFQIYFVPADHRRSARTKPKCQIWSILVIQHAYLFDKLMSHKLTLQDFCLFILILCEFLCLQHH